MLRNHKRTGKNINNSDRSADKADNQGVASLWRAEVKTFEFNWLPLCYRWEEAAGQRNDAWQGLLPV